MGRFTPLRIIWKVFLYIAWSNAIIASSDIINSPLILLKPNDSVFCRGYYKTGMKRS